MAKGCHHHGPDSAGPVSHSRRLLITLALVAIYCVAEVIGGLWTGSLALLADAGHMFSDMSALLISLFAAWISGKQPNQQKTFGYRRAEILAALANGALLLIVAMGILHEAWKRLESPQEILIGPMSWIALGGLFVNLTSLWILHGGKDENLNLRGAWLHVLGDALGSVGVLAAALLIWAFGLLWADPVASILVCLLISVSAWRLLNEALAILMEHAPRHIAVEDVRQSLLNEPGVVDVHCLHIWTIASGLNAISAHVVFEDDAINPQALATLRKQLTEKFDLRHITLQLESQSQGPCPEGQGITCYLTPPKAHHHCH